MGHIKLASPCAHIWYLRGVPSRMGMILDIPAQKLERVIYFAAYIITKVDEEAKKKILEEIDKEYKQKIKAVKKRAKEVERLKELRDAAKKEVEEIRPLRILNEIEYFDLSLKYGHIFEAGTGAETLRKIFEEIDLEKEIKKLEEKLEKAKQKKQDLTQGELRRTLRRLQLFRKMEEDMPPLI